MYDFQREVIEERFACRVFDYYALAERAVFSNECEQHQGHHLAMEYGLAEVIDADGQPVPDGAAGQPGRHHACTTSAMPLHPLRDQRHDARSSRRRARCGRGLELMEDVTTKAEDMLTLKDGRLISPSVLTHPFKPLDCIEGSQIVQTAHDALIVRIVAGAAYTPAHTVHLIAALQERLGADVRIDVQLVDRLEPSPNGKFKWVVSQIPLGI